MLYKEFNIRKTMTEEKLINDIIPNIDNMSREELIKYLPNHINSNHIMIFRWLDGCGWSLDCGLIHMEAFGDLKELLLQFYSEMGRYMKDKKYRIVKEKLGYSLRTNNPTD